MNDANVDLASVLRAIHELRQSRESPASRIIDFLGKLMIPIAVGVLALFGNMTASSISERTATAQREQKYIEIFVNSVIDPDRQQYAIALLDFMTPEDKRKFLGVVQQSEALPQVIRTEAFVAEDRQRRVDRLLDAIDVLPEKKIKSLATDPPVEDAVVKSMVDRRDPDGKRKSDVEAAREVLKMRVVMGGRSDADLNAWEAAVISAQ